MGQDRAKSSRRPVVRKQRKRHLPSRSVVYADFAATLWRRKVTHPYNCIARAVCSSENPLEELNFLVFHVSPKCV